MADSNPIGLFDSGVGGLSILQEIRKILPQENYVFLADQANVPYGEKTKKELNKLSERIANFLKTFDTKLLVVACNTASCYSIGYLRAKFTIPIVGVVPAVKTAVAITKNGKIAVMSTPATAKSTYLKNLVNQFAPESDVLRLGCEGLEESVEVLNRPSISTLLDKYTNNLKDFGSDVIILGCTHYPFLKKDIKKRLSSKTKIIDSGHAIAKRVKHLLKTNKSLSKQKIKDLYFTTADAKKFSNVASSLLKYKVIAKQAVI